MLFINKMFNCNIFQIGKPQIKMTKKTNTNKMSKTIVCHVEGFPKPAVQWTVTGSGSLINKASISFTTLNHASYVLVYKVKKKFASN